MDLSYDVISQFAKVVNQDKKQNQKNEVTVYGTIKVDTNTGAKYVQLDGSNEWIPLSDIDLNVSYMTAMANKDDRVSVLIKDHTATVTGNLTAPSVSSGDVTVQILDNTLEIRTDIENASKTATNFVSYDASNGVQVGNKQSGSWSGFRAQIASAAFNILNTAGTVIASYGAKLIELGKNATDAVIKFCGGKGQIEYDVDDDCLQLTADNVRLKGVEMASLYSNYTDSNDIFRNGAVHVSPANVQITAGGGGKNSNIHVGPETIILSSTKTYINGVLIDDDNVDSSYVSVAVGGSSIWEYRKYSNGDVELWGSYDINNMACTAAMGSMYRTAVFSPPAFPLTIYDPNLTASYESDGYGAFLWATTSTTTTKPPSYYLVRATSGTITSGKINFHVRGLWKQ